MIIYEDVLVGSIAEGLEHQKMLPIYLGLGYERDRFIRDYQVPRCTELDFEYLERHLHPGHNLLTLPLGRTSRFYRHQVIPEYGNESPALS